MDALDVGLLRTMGIDHWGRQPKSPESFRPSYLAKKLGTTEVTVRQRIKRLEAIGLLRGYQIVPNFRHLGFEGTFYCYKFAHDQDADAAVAKLAKLEGVSGTCSMTGSQLYVNIAYRTPADQQAKVGFLMRLAGDAPFLKYFDLEMPAVERPLSNLDWRIIHALRGRALRPLEEVADELGVSQKTVKRRFERMAKEGSFTIIPKIDMSRAEGMIPLCFNVHLDPEAEANAASKVLRALGDRYISVINPASKEIGHMSVSLFAATVAEVETLRARVAAVAGIARVDVGIVRGGSNTLGWLSAEIEKRIRETTPLAAVAA